MAGRTTGMGQCLGERIGMKSQEGVGGGNQWDVDAMLDRIVGEGILPFVVLEHRRTQDGQGGVDMGIGMAQKSQNPPKNIKNIDKIPPQYQPYPLPLTLPQKILTYNRKQKSLAELTRKFIEKFQHQGHTTLILDSVTQEMQVERRRIYDIINIMESLGVVTKERKNNYKWNGLARAIGTIQDMMTKHDREAQRQGLASYLPLENTSLQAGFPARSRKQKSLESLATEFLKIFSHTSQTLTLQSVSSAMISQTGQKQSKTKLRRLYDIVNVFRCLGLIEKVKLEGVKPGYRWIGCQGLLGVIGRVRDGSRDGVKEEEGDGEEEEKDQDNQPEVDPVLIKHSETKDTLSSSQTLRLHLYEQAKQTSPIARPLPPPFSSPPENQSYLFTILRTYEPGCLDNSNINRNINVSSNLEQYIDGIKKGLFGKVEKKEEHGQKDTIVFKDRGV